MIPKYQIIVLQYSSKSPLAFGPEYVLDTLILEQRITNVDVGFYTTFFVINGNLIAEEVKNKQDLYALSVYASRNDILIVSLCVNNEMFSVDSLLS